MFNTLLNKKNRHFIYEAIVFIVLFLIDIISKCVVFATIDGPKVIIPKVLTFIKSKNTGASFSMFSKSPWVIYLFSIIAVAVLIAFLCVKRNQPKFLRYSLVVILAGAMGNVADRITLGYVRDFIDYTIVKTLFNYDFAICNFADVVLCVGAGLLIFYVIFLYKEPDKKVKKDKEIASDND